MPAKTPKRILQDMFQGVVVDYEQRRDRFTGVITLPDEVLNATLASLRDLVEEERNNAPLWSGHKGFNKAIDRIKEVLK